MYIRTRSSPPIRIDNIFRKTCWTSMDMMDLKYLDITVNLHCCCLAADVLVKRFGFNTFFLRCWFRAFCSLSPNTSGSIPSCWSITLLEKEQKHEKCICSRYIRIMYLLSTVISITRDRFDSMRFIHYRIVKKRRFIKKIRLK